MVMVNPTLKKYWEVPLSFHSYYKYVFHFIGMADDGVLIDAYYKGKTGSEIYRFNVNRDNIYTIADSFDGSFPFTIIQFTKEGKEIYVYEG